MTPVVIAAAQLISVCSDCHCRFVLRVDREDMVDFYVMSCAQLKCSGAKMVPRFLVPVPTYVRRVDISSSFFQIAFFFLSLCKEVPLTSNSELIKLPPPHPPQHQHFSAFKIIRLLLD